ncbi:MAG: peptidyl-prolyl cis-trans isomerase SurA [Candidatus Binatia bacterium]|jgi:peptidyl-prolyl cis-trans isomerase SurA
MRRIFLIGIALLGASLNAPAAETHVVRNGIAAKVNDKIITQEQVRAEMDTWLRGQIGRVPEEALKREYIKRSKAYTDNLVEHELVLHDYYVSGYHLPESVVEEQIQRRIREQYGDRMTLAKSLRAKGGTIDKFKTNVREQIIVDQMFHIKVSSDIIVSPQKIRDYYQGHQDDYQVEEQVRLSQIYINQPADSPPDRARVMAGEILLKLDDGASFEEMARIYSEGVHAVKGGDRGWVEKSMLPETLAAVAFTLKKGARSGVIAINDACLIMKVEDIRGKSVKPLPEVADDIERALIGENRTRLHRQYINRLKTRQYIKYF